MSKIVHDKALENIMNALADTVVEMSDEEILAEARDEGQDPSEAAGQVRHVLLTTIQHFRQQSLRAAEKEYQAAVEALDKPKRSLPPTPVSRRMLLAAVLARRPEMDHALTVHHREFSQLTDVEVENYLKQFAALGVLDDVPAEEN